MPIHEFLVATAVAVHPSLLDRVLRFLRLK